MTALRRAESAEAVQPQTETRLLDWFDPIHDPGGVISRAVLRLDQLAAKRGVRLYPQTDFRALKAIVEAHRAEGTVLMPHVDPTYSTIDERNGIWVYGIDAEGRAASTQTGRYYDFTGTSLAEEMASFRFFYDDPSQYLNESCFCRTPHAASAITGTALASGTIWVRPDLRGPGEQNIVLSKLLGKLTRLIAIAQWWPEHLFTFSSYDLYNRRVVANFGWAHEAFPCEWVFPYGPVASAGMFWMTRQEMLDWAADEVRQLEAA
jgi:hypothetical protein